MPKWIHDRAQHIMAKNPEMPKSMAWAISTQQSHALGKSPKGYGTSEGRQAAKEKYPTPKDDKKTADPGGVGRKKFQKEAQFPSSTQLLGYRPRKEAGRLGLLDKVDLGEKLAAGFVDELRKIAESQMMPAAPTPASLTTINPKVPNKPLSGKVPTYSKNNSEVLESPAKGLQPLAQPPQVRR